MERIATMSDTIFGKIAAGEVSADIVYEDEDLVAFRDLHPQAPTISW
jgi:histidine triad (HIT) family protein